MIAWLLDRWRRHRSWKKVRTFIAPPLLKLDTERWGRVRKQGLKVSLAGQSVVEITRSVNNDGVYRVRGWF